MVLSKLMSGLMFITLASAPLVASHHHHHDDDDDDCFHEQAYGKLSASPIIDDLFIDNPQVSLPSVSGWQPFPVDTFSTYLNTASSDPTDAVISVQNSGTYLINALLTLQYPTPGTDGPDDLTNYCIAVMINDQLQLDSIGSMHISTEGGHENPGLLFSCSLSDLIALDANDTIQFVVAGGSGSEDAVMVVSAANATVVRIGD